MRPYYNTINFRAPKNNLVTVSVSGAVEFPGTYVLSNDSTVEDLYQLVGKFKKQAYLEGIILTRQVIRERQIKSIKKAKEDLNNALLTMSSSQKDNNFDALRILMSMSESIDPENLGRLAGNFSPKSKTSMNTILFDGDSIEVPKNPNSINVFGEVLNPIAFAYKENITTKSAIERAGGYKKLADKRKVYVIRVNGIVKKANRNIFTGNIKLQPGDTIVVPRKNITNNPLLDVLTPITNVISNLAITAAALDNLSNN